jgi:hypothetical protein
MIRSCGFTARACSTTWPPSKPSGIATVGGLELRADEAADAAVADQHDMLGQLRHRDGRARRPFRLGRCRRLGRRLLRRLVMRMDPVGRNEQERGEQDRN